MKKLITIGVTGLNNVDSPGSGVSVIRGLRESLFNVRIIGLSYEALEPGLYMDGLLDKSYQIPIPSTGSEALKNRIAYINQQENLDFIIPNFDAELHNFIKISDKLKEEYNIITFLPTLEQLNARDKSVLFEFGKTYDVKVPYAKPVYSANEIYSLTNEFVYPIVIKGKFYEAYIAATPEQAITYFYKISAKWGLPVIAQEFISGSEVNVTAIGDGNGNCIGAVPMRKLYITDKGKAWAGIVLDDPELVKIANRVVSASKWKGGCELEFIKSKEGEYYLLEMNPRFPAWVYLAVGCGQNHPEALIKLALGKKVKPFETFDVGKMFVRYSYDQIVDLAKFQKISTTGEL